MKQILKQTLSASSLTLFSQVRVSSHTESLLQNPCGQKNIIRIKQVGAEIKNSKYRDKLTCRHHPSVAPVCCRLWWSPQDHQHCLPALSLKDLPGFHNLMTKWQKLLFRLLEMTRLKWLAYTRLQVCNRHCTVGWAVCKYQPPKTMCRV